MFVDASAFTGLVAVGQLPMLLPLAALVVTLVTPVSYLLVERPATRVGSWIVGREFRRTASVA
jgi:hypothetical protein